MTSATDGLRDLPTADQLEAGIANALHAGDIEAVGDFLRVLVIVDPLRAETVYDLLKIGVALGKGGIGEER